MDNVQAYNDAHLLQLRDARDFIEEFSDEISEMKGKCIDIGCGPGTVTNDLILPRLSKSATLIGADISRTMLSYARRTYEDTKRLSFLELDIETEELPKHEISRYDNAVSLYCLHWCQNPRRAFENIYQILKPGGKGLVTFIAYNNGFDAYLRLHNSAKYGNYMKDAMKYVPYFHRCVNPRATLKKILEESGFEVMHCSRREKSFVFKNMQTLQDHAMAVNPFLDRIPENLKEEFKHDVTREISSNKILFVNRDNENLEYSILDRYYVLIAYFKKPEKNLIQNGIISQ